MNKLLPLLFALLAVGCEVLEEDISGVQVRITAPSDRVSVAGRRASASAGGRTVCRRL